MTTMVTDTLHRRRDMVVPALRDAVATMDPTSRALASYHLGWTDIDGRPESGNGGKAIRPALALLSAEAAGQPATAGLSGAVAVELVHNFSLLHDDLMDGDVERRHRRTVWAQWGAASAILTGDAMLALAQRVLLDDSSPHAPAAGRLLAGTTAELIRGQVDDVAFERRTDVTVDECLAMAAGKTGALLSASATIGAVLAGAPIETVAALRRYGEQLGLAFQLVDDLLGIWGDPDRTGKPVLSDLRARKKSLPVTYAISQGGQGGRALSAWLDAPEPPTEDDLHRAADLVAAAGGRAWAAAEAERCLHLAEHALDTVLIPPEARDELVALARFVVSRED